MEDVLQTALVLLGLDVSNPLLELCVKTVTQQILTYCNLDTFPNGLKFVAGRMAADAYRAYTDAASDVPGAVTSLSEDGRTVTYAATSQVAQFVADRVSTLTELREYRKVRW